MRLLAASLAMAGLSACGPALRPPLLSLGDRVCGAAPDLTHAVPVPFNSLRGAAVELDERSPCVQPDDRSHPATTYAAFALPRTEGTYALTFESLDTGGIVSKPVVTLLDVAGRTLRTLADSEYEHLGTGLRAGLRVGPQEAFLFAQADGAVVGSGLRLHYGQAAAPIRLASKGAVVIFVPPPVPDRQIPPNVLPALYGLNGTFHVVALPIPTVK